MDAESRKGHFTVKEIEGRDYSNIGWWGNRDNNQEPNDAPISSLAIFKPTFLWLSNIRGDMTPHKEQQNTNCLCPFWLQHESIEISTEYSHSHNS